MRYTEIEIRPSYSQIVYYETAFKTYDFYIAQGYTAWEIWRDGIYTGPRTVLLHTGKFEGDTWVEGVDIEFDVGKRKDEETEKGEIKVWNLSSEVLHFMKVGCIITVKSGYADHYDTIFYGSVTEVSTKRSDGDEETTIKVFGSGDRTADINAMQIYITSFEKDIVEVNTFKYLFDKILKDTGFAAVYVGVGNEQYNDICAEGMGRQSDDIYCNIPKGPGVSTTKQKLKELLDDAMIQTDNYFFWTVINNRIYFIRKGYSLPAYIRLTPLSGLLEYKPTPSEPDNSPVYEESEEEETEEEEEEIHEGLIGQDAIDLYEVKSIMIYDIIPNSLIVIQPTLTGDSYMYRVRECDYKSIKDEHVVEFIAEKLYVFNQAPVYAEATP